MIFIACGAIANNKKHYAFDNKEVLKINKIKI